MLSLMEAMDRLDASVDGLFEPRDAAGHSDLPGYQPYMGPRYGFPGHSTPLSIFRGEAMALFLLARALRPDHILECYTGTGYSAACLALGWPAATVWTVDNYSEGGIGEATGPRMAAALWERAGCENIRAYRTLASGEATHERIGLAFSDGPYDGFPALSPDAVRIRHDDTLGREPGRSFTVRGGSHLSITCQTPMSRDSLLCYLGRILPVEAV